ncbi:putative cytosol aminopeptidase [Microlunatus endophyticus]|uniref:Probable cytosol aminopeptidase n=1 Tax=Microlunatus endophyticus TaxID=1716077 RepID=A0A917VZ91_9ACTN|nr:leucyl aminopeptidase [Microlunatus endophyticus]GGL48111.1 putative cytosol aminopeptidase [Microlunatus endophyticus]
MPAPLLPSAALARSVSRSTAVVIAGLNAHGVVGVPDQVGTSYRKKLGTAVGELAESMGASAKPLATTVLPRVGGTSLVLVGLGDKASDDLSEEELRAAAGAGVRAASGLELSEASVAVSFGSSEPGALRATMEGALLGSYTFGALTSAAVPTPKIATITVISRSTGKQQVAAVEAAEIVAAAVIADREWINQPANLLYPESFADDVRDYAAAAKSKINVEILDERALTRGGYGGLLAVGGGSAKPPRLVRLSYSPRGANTHLGLVGKGITFDSGGLDIKSPAGMYTMKCDMSGAGAVFAAIRAIADLGLKIKVTAYGSLAENMPSGSAWRPSDVLTIYGGKTVENVNSDAEGRIVMADALARSSAEDKPDLIIDVATLTGAAVTALGERTAAVFASSDEVAEQVITAAATAGERFWQLPIVDEARGHLDSEVADIRSGRAGGGAGGAITAAAFLREFVGDTPWAHLDIAGPAFNSGSAYGYVPSGGTGAAVRTLVAVAESLAG